MKSTNLAEHVREVQSSLVGNGRFVHASNNKPFSAGTKGQLHGLSLNTGTEEATEKKTKYLLGRGVAVLKHICILVM